MPTIEELSELKLETFDPIYSEIAAIRVISYLGVREKLKYNKVVPAIRPIIEGTLNPFLIDEIVKPRFQFEQFSTQKKPSSVYIPEDKVRRAVRTLVEFYHSSPDGMPDKVFHRKLVKSCMAMIIEISHDEIFTDQVYSAASKALK